MSFMAAACTFIGVALMCLAGFVITSYDVRTIVLVVAIVFLAIAVLFEAVERGFWR